MRREREPTDSVVGILAHHIDADGRCMTEAAAAVELLNILRPIVAVGRYVVLAAHALHVHRKMISHGGGSGPTPRS